MENYRINTNYAKSLFLLATDTEKVDVVYNDMRMVRDVFSENHVLNVVFANPVIKDSKKMAIANDLFGEKVDDLTMLFIRFVVKKHRVVNLKGIALSYMDLYRESNNIVLSELRTAIDVDEETKEIIKQIVGDYTHCNVELNTITDNKMLGGFCVSFDNNLYDARLRTRIAKLRKEFSKNVYEKGI
ncbi:MAG: ATP synthase F1 subunit delta [Bacteroidales bacterium]|nr:ATP synthase F1 subunit delta [Bacteroidales bacterium]